MAPRISVIMANRDRGAYLAEAVRSVQAQTIADWELVLADDGSIDDSLAIARDLAAEDPRLRLLPVGDGRGPGVARNRAIEAARGEWLAIVDSDDVIEPGRFARLLALADEQDAEAVADDLLYFGDPASEGRCLLAGYRGSGCWRLGPEEFLQAHILKNRLPQLGYLKPMIRREALGPLRYDETLRIGEDSDILLRFLMTGRRMVVTPEALYRYRRHPGSISHRWQAEDLRALVTVQRRQLAMADGRLWQLMAERLRGMERGLAVEEVVGQLKAGRLGAALMRLLVRPGLVRPLAGIAGASLRRRALAGAGR